MGNQTDASAGDTTVSEQADPRGDSEGPHFARIGREVSERRDIHAGTKLVYGWIWAHDGTPKGCTAGAQTLGKECGLSEKQVRNHIETLVALGLLDREVRKGKTWILRARAIRNPGTVVPDTPEVGFRRKEKVKENINPDSDSEGANLRGDNFGDGIDRSRIRSGLQPLEDFIASVTGKTPSQQTLIKVMRKANGKSVATVLEFLRLTVAGIPPGSDTYPKTGKWFISTVEKEYQKKDRGDRGGASRGAADAIGGPPPPDKATAPYWERVKALYPKKTHQVDAQRWWIRNVDGAPDALAEAPKVVDAVTVIAERVRAGRLFAQYLPNLRNFIRGKRYLEDWRTATSW